MFGKFETFHLANNFQRQLCSVNLGVVTDCESPSPRCRSFLRLAQRKFMADSASLGFKVAFAAAASSGLLKALSTIEHVWDGHPLSCVYYSCF
jgi:hypothetical protein